MTFYSLIFYTYLLILLTAAFISLRIYNYKPAPLYLKLFPPFLFLTLLVEIAGYIMRVNYIPNPPLFNLFSVLEFVFYFYMLHSFIKNKAIKKLIHISIFLYPVIALLNIFFIQGFQAPHSYTIILGTLLIVIACGCYFVEAMMRKDALSASLHEPAFWICAGLSFFYSIYFPVVGAMNLAGVTELFNTSIIQALQVFPNYLLYTSFAVAFFCFYKIKSHAPEIVKP